MDEHGACMEIYVLIYLLYLFPYLCYIFPCASFPSPRWPSFKRIRRRTKKHGLVWFGGVWYEMIWYDMRWYEKIWYDMRWYEMVYIYICVCVCRGLHASMVMCFFFIWFRFCCLEILQLGHLNASICRKRGIGCIRLSAQCSWSQFGVS